MSAGKAPDYCFDVNPYNEGVVLTFKTPVMGVEHVMDCCSAFDIAITILGELRKIGYSRSGTL